jgi:Putative peptidoglycan binding domain
MAGEPTLYHGDQSADGWVEYLQELLTSQGHLEFETFTVGKFDDATLAAVKKFQKTMEFEDTRGIVGDQTWSALRGEPVIAEAGDDGLAPHTYRERGIEVRFENEIRYDEPHDLLEIVAMSVGDVQPAEGSLHPFVHLKKPDGSSENLTARHNASDLKHFFTVDNVADGVPGTYTVLIQLPQETGGDTQQFEFVVDPN